MNKFKAYLSHKREENPFLGLLDDFLTLLSIPGNMIKTKSLKPLFSPQIGGLCLCCSLTYILYISCFEVLPTLVCIPLFLATAFIAEALISKARKYNRYDAEHKVFRAVNHPYGMQEFMTTEERKRILEISNNINTFTGLPLGLDQKGRMLAKKENIDIGNCNALIVGNSGTKKGVANIIPRCLQLCQIGRSHIIVSTKDDNYATMGRILRKNGFKKVWVFSLIPDELEHSDGIDILTIIDGSPEIAQTVADDIVANTSPGEKPDYWYRGERNLLFALLIYFSLMGKSLTDLYRFLFIGLEQLQIILDSLPINHPAYGPYRIFRGGDSKNPKAKEQVYEGLGIRFSSFMASPYIQEIMSHNDIDFKRMTQEKCALFVIVPDNTSVYKALSSTFMSVMFFELERIAKSPKNKGTLPSPLEIIIDEAFACGSIPGYAGIISTIRGYGVHVTTTVQSIPQLKSMYPDSWESILNDCGIKILVHTDDKITAEYFSILSGTFTAELESKNSMNELSSLRETPVPLLSVSDCLGLDINKQVIYITGANHPTMVIDKLLWYSNWPGSKSPFFNKKDGLTYNSHPLLKDFKYLPVKTHTPAWKRQENSENALPNPNKRKFSKIHTP